jgi:hypothetical protein
MATITAKDIKQLPGVISFVMCSEAGDIVEQEGSEAEVLSTVLIYFQQVAGLIGESFGLEELQEAHIQGKTLTVLCLPHQGGSVGVVLNSRTRVNEVTASVRQILSAA